MMTYIDLSEVILGEEGYGVVDLVSAIFGAILGGTLLAWVTREGDRDDSVRDGSAA